MKILPWVLSGVLLVCVLPVLLVLEAMALGSPQISDGTRSAVGGSLALIPFVWVLMLILCIVEAKRRMRPKRMRLYYLLPFAALGMHVVVLVLKLR